MNISKISRSIVVVIFIAMIIFLSYLDIRLMLGSEGTSVSSNLIKILYMAVLVILVLIYMYIKDKLYKLKIKRKIAFVYRYIYITLVIISAIIYFSFDMLKSMSSGNIAAFIILSVITSFIIKRIIFNVSKSDMLSIFGMFAFAMLPNIINNTATLLNSILINLVVFAAILALQILIDELKQRGVRTSKYLIESIIVGSLIGFCTLLGINIYVFLILAVLMFFITSNLDNTHINFPRGFMDKLTQTKREDMYKIERINISKLAITLVVVISIAVVINVLGNIVIPKVSQMVPDSSIMLNIENNFNQSNISNISFNISNIKETGKDFVSFSKTYYMFIFMYILFMEILAIVLKRRYDTKSTVMKLIFMLIFLSISLLNIDLILYQPLFSIMLVLIAIVNTSNIYLNREERIKMLVA